MNEENFDVFCPNCNIMVESKTIAKGSAGYSSSALNPIDELDSEYHGDILYITLCNRCNQPFLIKRSLYGIPGEFETITDETILFPNETEVELDNLPTEVKKAYEQASRSYSASLYEPCVLMCRKSLEVVCKLFNASGKNLYQRLQNLQINDHIDQRLLKWSHEIRNIGNDAAHDISLQISKEDAKDCLDLTEAILIYIYSLGIRFENFKSRRPKK